MLKNLKNSEKALDKYGKLCYYLYNILNAMTENK